MNRHEEVRAEIHPQIEMVLDTVSVLAMDGVETTRISVLDVLQRSPYAYLLPSFSSDLISETGAALDVLHTNHVEVFDGKLAARSELFKKGNLLLSSRNINAIFIVDPGTQEIVWLWGPGNLTFQDHPTLLDNGNILLFDNGLDASRVVELDPLNRKIVWQYEADGFFSETRGSVQRLDNGNTLITESDSGYAFEVTHGGDVVWKFANPDVDAEGNRSAIWRMKRYAAAELGFVLDK
ncbi:MAG: outer membrane protein assembly factor BamB [Hyphomicrobiaceae bacterium]